MNKNNVTKHPLAVTITPDAILPAVVKSTNP